MVHFNCNTEKPYIIYFVVEANGQKSFCPMVFQIPNKHRPEGPLFLIEMSCTASKGLICKTDLTLKKHSHVVICS